MKLQVGQVVQDRFEVERVLGAGGTAVVYLVKDRGTGVKHALKVLTISSQAIRERMLREGDVQRRIDHPNVIKVTEVLDLDGAPGLIMEFIDGPSLEQALGRYRLTMGDAETLFQGILAGVAAAHAEGLVHRDLKPANILLSRTRDGFVPKVTDFGLAKLTDGDGGGGVAQTRSGIAMGTPSYMSPEQIRDARSVDQRADLWSLGCLLYELVTRQRAFPGDEALAIYNAIVDCEFVPVRKLVPDIPARIEQAIHGCIRLELGDRIPDCEHLLAVLLGGMEWPLPENTLTELARETPTMPRPPGMRSGEESMPLAGRRNVEFHPGGAPSNSAGASVVTGPTELAPMSPPSQRSSSSGFAGPGLGSAEAETPAPAPVVPYDGDEAETVITRVALDGTLAPHESPVPGAASQDRAGWFLGGGLLAMSLLTVLAVSAAAIVVAGVWWFSRPLVVVSPTLPPPTPVVVPVEKAPGPPVEKDAVERPRPAEVAPVPRPATPAPAPAEPQPATPPAQPHPPVTSDRTRSNPDSGVVDKAEVRIGTVPYGAQVQIGNLVGTSPYKVSLTPSRHPVIVSAPGYEPFSELIGVTAGGANVWCFDLVEKRALPQACP